MQKFDNIHHSNHSFGDYIFYKSLSFLKETPLRKPKRWIFKRIMDFILPLLQGKTFETLENVKENLRRIAKRTQDKR